MLHCAAYESSPVRSRREDAATSCPGCLSMVGQGFGHVAGSLLNQRSKLRFSLLTGLPPFIRCWRTCLGFPRRIPGSVPCEVKEVAKPLIGKILTSGSCWVLAHVGEHLMTESIGPSVCVAFLCDLCCFCNLAQQRSTRQCSAQGANQGHTIVPNTTEASLRVVDATGQAHHITNSIGQRLQPCPPSRYFLSKAHRNLCLVRGSFAIGA
mmetsp:Transcript_21903/g.46550  ORF Transcript_21903/g.46550 Transcript_21903/m.46550 type:complete len:209 (-) Transcript_21903:370-996(-)